MNDKELKFDNFLQNANNLEIDDEIFIQLLNNYQFSLKEGDEHIYNAKRNKKYIIIQRYIMEELELIDKLNLIEYEEIVSMISKRPVEDNNYVNRYYKYLDDYLCNSFDITDENIKKRFIYYIKRYRKIIEYIENNNNFKYVINFTFDKSKYEIDEKRNVYVDGQFEKKCKGLMLEDDEDFKLDFSNVDFNKLKIKKLKLKEELIKRKKDIKCILDYLIFISNNLEKNNEIKEKTLAK